VKNWKEYIPGTEEAILTLDSAMRIFSTPRHRSKMSGNYITSSPGYAEEFFQLIKEITGNSPFWDPRG